MYLYIPSFYSGKYFPGVLEGTGVLIFSMSRNRLNTQNISETLPGFEQGLNRVESDVESSVFPLLVGEHLSRNNSKAVWVDSGNTSSTYAMASSGGEEVLDQVVVARAFTGFQHFHICNRLEEFLTQDTEYIVLPNIDQQYREGLSEKERNDLFLELISKLKSIKTERPEIKIIYGFHTDDSSQINLELISITDNVVRVEKTDYGLKDSQKQSRGFYRDSGMLQTTVPYWVRRTREKEGVVEVKNRNGEDELNL